MHYNKKIFWKGEVSEKSGIKSCLVESLQTLILKDRNEPYPCLSWYVPNPNTRQARWVVFLFGADTNIDGSV